MNIQGFVLTIDKVGGLRRANATKQLDGTEIPFEFVEGVSSEAVGTLGVYSPVMNFLLHKRSLSRGEIAIYEGHRRIWREIVNRGIDVALVMEDDFQILDHAGFEQATRDLLAAPDKWDIAKFFDFRPKRTIHKMVLGQTTLLAYKYPAAGAVAYLINTRTAAAFLKRKSIYRAVDEDFAYPWEFSIHVWSVSPNVVDEISQNLGGSLVEDEREYKRTHQNRLRSIYGNILQGWKFSRSIIYRRSYSAISRAD